MIPSNILTSGMTRTMLPMISSTDPFMCGPAALVDPNDILNIKCSDSYSYYSYSNPSKESGKCSVDFDDSVSATNERIDDILQSINSDEDSLKLELDFETLEDFLNSMQTDYPHFISNEYSGITLPDSPVSLDDFEILPDVQDIQNSNFIEPKNDTIEVAVFEESLLPVVVEPLVVEQSIEAETEVSPKSKSNVYKARSGRVVKRKIYEDEEEDTDEDYNPPTRKQPKKRCSNTTSKKAPCSKRVRIYDEETKRQNMIAARRYREKKRSQQITVDDIYDKEAERNSKLCKDIEELQSEINILKDLLGSFLTPHRLVYVQVSNWT